MENANNSVIMTGRLCGEPVFSHEMLGEAFFSADLSVLRLSGQEDRIPITLPGRLIAAQELNDEQVLRVTGQLRSYNRLVDGVGRLCLSVFARDVEVGVVQDCENQACLQGTICRLPTYRTTPLGREICDVMLAVNRSFSKSDYIPCISWGRNAKFVSTLTVGNKIALQGRLQSREYQKQLEDGTIMTRIAYEVSVYAVEAVEQEYYEEAFTSTAQ